jgi:hypothetical protein
LAEARKVCLTCGATFFGDNRQVRCSAECRQRNKTSNESERTKLDRRSKLEQARECDLCGRRYIPANGRVSSRTDKTGRVRITSSKYCSDYCTRRAAGIKQYGLTNEEFRNMVKDRRCSLCGRKMTLKEFNIDHDHSTNETYGAVCSACNMMLAVIRRNPVTAFRTIEYLTIPPARAMRGEAVYITETMKNRLAKKSKTPSKKNSSFRRVYRR